MHHGALTRPPRTNHQHHGREAGRLDGLRNPRRTVAPLDATRPDQRRLEERACPCALLHVERRLADRPPRVLDRLPPRRRRLVLGVRDGRERVGRTVLVGRLLPIPDGARVVHHLAEWPHLLSGERLGVFDIGLAHVVLRQATGGAVLRLRSRAPEVEEARARRARRRLLGRQVPPQVLGLLLHIVDLAHACHHVARAAAQLVSLLLQRGNVLGRVRGVRALLPAVAAVRVRLAVRTLLPVRRGTRPVLGRQHSRLLGSAETAHDVLDVEEARGGDVALLATSQTLLLWPSVLPLCPTERGRLP